jgi:hypothetical protein
MDGEIVRVGLENLQASSREFAQLNVADVREVIRPDMAAVIHRARDVQVEPLAKLLVRDTHARTILEVEDVLALLVWFLVTRLADHVNRIHWVEALLETRLKALCWFRLEQEAH